MEELELAGERCRIRRGGGRGISLSMPGAALFQCISIKLVISEEQ